MVNQETDPYYIDPLNDFAFKKIFGSENSKELLKSFLNHILEGRRSIESMAYRKNEYPGEGKDEGGAIIDIVCRDQNGGTFLIEIQKAGHKFFIDRSLFYAARLISEQAPKGAFKKWGYQLKDVYLIAILENFSLEGPSAGNWRHDVSLVSQSTSKIFYDKLGFTYIELLNFNKAEHELSSVLDKWLYSLKYLKKLKQKPASFTEPELVELFSMTRYINLTKKEKEMYNSRIKAQWDNQNVIDYAIEKGEIRGKHEEALEIAREMKANNEPFDKIVKYTKLSIEEIEGL